ncbi:MAG: UvrD-helicase domain-containing protein [Candidatus Gastranaerophilales bacterium]|nr:UvrD-helicase domain-containing protein [Candidatus Gastranaerophilales bacterium]
MLINAPSNTNRTKLLVEKYLKLLKSGVEASNVLVLVQNSRKKKEFIDEIKRNFNYGSIGDLKVYSFSGLVYNYILENWVLIENSIRNENRKIMPNMCGLEVSQYILKKCIQEVDFTGYNSKTSLLHQLFRRNSLINLNNLSKEEIDFRVQILEESFSAEAQAALDKYKLKSIEKRAFDYIRQINLFEFLYKKQENKFEYVFLDDADEITPALFAYLEHIKPTVKEFFIGYDINGSSRLGYLSAINIDFEKFLGVEALKPFENDKKTMDALLILEKVKNDEKIALDSISTKSYLKRNEMVDGVIKNIKNLINNGVKPSDIAIVTPNSDDFLKTYFDRSGFKFNFLTKNEKLNQNKLIGYILELLKTINDTKNLDVSPYVLKGIFIELLNFDKKETIKIIQEYKLERDFKNINIFDLAREKNFPEFQKLTEIYEKIRFEKLSTQLYEIVSNFVEMNPEKSKDIIKINQLLKQIYDFEEVFGSEVSNQELINQLENTIISENPLSDDEIDEESIIVSSAQKIIDYSYKTKYQFWLDVNSENWLKQDIGPLYNAWVMQKSWSKETFELEDNIELTKDRTARILYKLYLLTDNITLYSSVYDSLGIENGYGIDKYFQYKNDVSSTPSRPIIPRPDQQDVLNYKGGLMSVSATAGSGKTTIMLLLVDKILSGEILSNIESKNIFVLTFMESAARNFRERIKAKYPDLAELPNISTIHGLALKIIKENNNFARVGLDYDFEIIDEIKRSAILAEITYSIGIPPEKTSLYDSAISAYKNELAIDSSFICQDKLFLSVYSAYQNKLKEQNLIDYDDLLLLSLNLLREHPDVLEHYQNLAKIIIEDEAQDSSYTQQSLITLLGGKYKNIIRCGDINQAITSTFSNSDVEGFRNFMKNSNNVEMDRCQRCATGVLDCANGIVDWANSLKINAFSSLVMKPVENVNIVDKNAVSSKVFDAEIDESKFILSEIKEIFKNEPSATVAVLLRSNFAINKWDKLLSENSIKTYKNSDNLINNPVYRICLLVLEYISNPYELKTLKELSKELFELGYYSFDTVKYTHNLDKPLFLRDDFDEQFWWDMNYFLFKNHYSIYDLVFEIGSFYFSNTAHNVNIALVATIAQKTMMSQKTFEDTVFKLREIQFKNNFSNIKFFSLEDNSKKQATVQIMTLHKSKGDEFDYVFIPELTQDNLCFDVAKYKLKENSKFIQKIKKQPKTDLELKMEIIEENFRLIYVGITRAKKKLLLSTASNYKFFSKVQPKIASEIFERLEYAKN